MYKFIMYRLLFIVLSIQSLSCVEMSTVHRSSSPVRVEIYVYSLYTHMPVPDAGLRISNINHKALEIGTRPTDKNGMTFFIVPSYSLVAIDSGLQPPLKFDVIITKPSYNRKRLSFPEDFDYPDVVDSTFKDKWFILKRTRIYGPAKEN